MTTRATRSFDISLSPQPSDKYGQTEIDATETVIRFIREARWADLPSAVRRQAKRCLLDTLGALLAGTATPVSRMMAAFAWEQFKGNEATILVEGRLVSAVGAALANGFAANALDIDDGYRLIKGHPGACVLPPALAAAELEGCSGQEFLTALVIGYEVGIRAGLIRHATSATYHSSGSWGAIAGAAAAARSLRLDATATRHALGAAEYHAPIAPMMKGIATPNMGKDSVGWGCMVAMSSALMGRRGFTGVQPLFNDSPQPTWIESLGEQYEILNLYFKPHAVCRWAQPPIEGALRLIHDHGIVAGQIARIVVRTFAEAAALDRRPPQTTEDAQYNLAYPLAVALLDGEVGPRQVMPPRIHGRDVLALMSRVEVIAEARFQSSFPAQALAEVTIMTVDGAAFHSGIVTARWEPPVGLPSDGELAAKFHSLVGSILGQEKARAIEQMIGEFECESDVNSLINLCIGREPTDR